MLDGDPRPAELHVAGVAVRPLTPAISTSPSVQEPPGSTLLSPAKVRSASRPAAPDYLLLGARVSANPRLQPPRDLDPGHLAAATRSQAAGVNLLRSGHAGLDTHRRHARATLLPGPVSCRYTIGGATGKPLSRASNGSISRGGPPGSDLRGQAVVGTQSHSAAQPASGATTPTTNHLSYAPEPTCPARGVSPSRREAPGKPLAGHNATALHSAVARRTSQTTKRSMT